MALTQERLKELLHYDPASGLFTWKVYKNRKARAGDPAGRTNSQGRIQIGIEGQRYLAHRLAWLYVHGNMPAHDIDHVDTNYRNNAISNLRLDPLKLNQQNQRYAHSNSKSGHLGVSPLRGKWAATISVGGKRKHLGVFGTPEDAHAAYLEAKRIYHPFNTL